MRRSAETQPRKIKRSETRKPVLPGYAYEIDFRTCDIRRRMLAALNSAA